MVALGFFDGSVGLWNLEDASEPIWLNQIHDKEVLALVFTPDGSRLFSGGKDSTIRIWDTTTGESFGPLVGHEDYVFSLDISDDGKRLVSGSGDNTVRIWDATLPRSRETDLP
jgi:WD40 repeat protein